MTITNTKSVRKWGGSTTDAVLDGRSTIFHNPQGEGLIGYREEEGCAVVLGDPICPFSEIEQLVSSFQEHCAKKELKVIYLIISEEFARFLEEKKYSKVLIEYGEELVINPQDDPRKKEGEVASLVRRKTKHALHEGVLFKEYIPFDSTIEKGILEVGDKWLKGRKGPQIHFSHIDPFGNSEGKRWFYVEKGGEIIGVATLNLLEKHQGWLLNHLMFTPEAPGGVPELIVIEILEVLAKEGCHHVTFGTVPLNELGEIQGLGKIGTFFAKGIYAILSKIYHLSGKKKFWGKFFPESKRAFIAFEKKSISLREVLALKKTLNATLFTYFK